MNSRNGIFQVSATAALILASAPGSAAAAPCPVSDKVFEVGGEPPLSIDKECVDPDYNEKTFVIDGTESLSFKLPDGSRIPYIRVKGHFPPTRTQAELPSGITGSPTTATHSVTWDFPDKSLWRKRFYQQSYPLPIDFLNTVDSRFAFIHGGYTVSVMPGSFNTGYRVSAAAVKLAKAYAAKLYGTSDRIYGYIYGQSGGSVQMMAANEGTAGVWDGIVPVVIATDGLNTHSFQWGALYALAVSEDKRQIISEAAAPGSGRDLYQGLTGDEKSVLNELLNAGFARKALEGWKFSVSSALPLSGALPLLDPSYEDDFWSKPGYEGTNPPAYLKAARVDGFAQISEILRDEKKAITAISFRSETVPALGSIGAEGLQFYVYSADGTTRITNGQARGLSGNLEGNKLTLSGQNDPALLATLSVGGKIRINNRFLLAACFYPRHSILDNGSPAYNQYKNADGTPRYVQRAAQAAYAANVGSAGGRRETGNIKVRTIVLENLSDPASYPYVGGFYAQQVQKAIGTRASDLFRIYYQENAHHGAFPTAVPGMPNATGLASVGGILNQTLLDLAEWAEKGTPPLPSTKYRFDAMNQVVLPNNAKKRRGLQPSVRLSANGSVRAVVAANAPVVLTAHIEMPPRAGKIVQYDWFLGTPDGKFEPLVELAQPAVRMNLKRSVRFAKPGDYSVTLRVRGQRQGIGGAESMTLLENLARVRIVAR